MSFGGTHGAVFFYMDQEKYKPLIKYTGGKYDEYKFFKSELPEKINNYYEPFFGGGGVFFQLHNENRIKGNSYVNDISKDLMEFYANVTNPVFANKIRELDLVWKDVATVARKIYEKYSRTYFNVVLGMSPITELINPEIKAFIGQEIEKTEHLSKYNTHGYNLVEKIYDGIEDKTKRFIKKNIGEEEVDIPEKSITTAVHQAFYFIVRDMYNDWLLGGQGYSVAEKSSHWFFIREFCYGSMFRFSREGKFNVPYGGFGYNDKCFTCKVDEICSEKVQKLFSSTSLFSEDFSVFLNRKFNEDDFIFLDPPYDSTFSDYDNNSFTREDQKRLKECLDGIKAKWLLVIRKNDFISGLYEDYTQIPFDKTYSYHARGTYDDKNCTHIAIRNF